jgi:hypothetical protein
MLVRFFRSHQPVLLIIIPLLGLLMWLPAFLHPLPLVVSHPMPLFELLTKPLISHPFLASLLAFLLLLLQAFLFNFILEKYEFSGKPTYLPALLYIVFASFAPGLLQLHPALIASIFILLALHRILGTYRITNAYAACFEAGFLISLASLFYFPAILCIIFIFIAILLLRPFSGREWIIASLGFLLPCLYVFCYYFVIDGLRFFWADRILFPLLNRDIKLTAEIVQPYAELVLFVLIAVVLSMGKGTDLGSRSVQYRSNVGVMRWLLVIGLMSLVLAPGLNYTNFFIALIPLLVVICNYFLWARVVWLSDLILGMIILAIAFNHY